MGFILSWLFIGQIQLAMAKDVALVVDQFNPEERQTRLRVQDGSLIPKGTQFRILTQTGECLLRVIDQVDDELVASNSEDCSSGAITPGMELAYSDASKKDEDPGWQPSPYKSQTSYDKKNIVTEILSRSSVFIGHNFARQLEGNVYDDGSVRDLRGGSALSLGVKGRVYDFTDRISIAAELGYESPRTMDRASFLQDGEIVNQGTQGFSPRLSLWSLAVQAEGKVSEEMNAFLGINLSFPSLSNAPFAMAGGFGFQAGINQMVWNQVAIEGLIKITNMSLNNDIGQSTDVTLAGLELRGRYTF